MSMQTEESMRGSPNYPAVGESSNGQGALGIVADVAGWVTSPAISMNRAMLKLIPGMGGQSMSYMG